MRIAKFGHSCLLVETASAARILVDPGVFSVIPDEVTASKLDAVLITHSHPDHLDFAVIDRLIAVHPDIAIYSASDIVTQLAERGISAVDHAFSAFDIAGTTIEPLEAGHEAILAAAPINSAYRIDGELVITGDSAAVALDVWIGSRVLALPIAAPWTTEVRQAAFLEHMKPEVAFAVHDGILIENFRSNAEKRFANVSGEHGIVFKQLNQEPQEV